MNEYKKPKFAFILVLVFLLLIIVAKTSGRETEITKLGLTEIVSVASDGITKGNYDSHQTAISADGQHVAFWSWSDNLVDNDTNTYCSTFTPPSCPDIFVRDRSSGTTVRVSIASDGTEAEHWSQNPSISQNGRFVAFNSYANNLVDNDTNNCNLIYGTTNCSDVFVHDRDADENGIFDETDQPGQVRTVRVSVTSGGIQGNAHSIDPSISADGRFIAFSSGATNLDINDNPSVYDVFLHDRDSDEDGIFDEPGEITRSHLINTFEAG